MLSVKTLSAVLVLKAPKNKLRALITLAFFVACLAPAYSQCGMTIKITAPLSVMGTNITLATNVSGGVPPYTYNWQPNAFFVPPSNVSQQNPVLSPSISVVYTVTVKGANGCLQTQTVEVISQPYARVDVLPNGGYYNVVNNKLLFIYDGPYAPTGLTYKIYNGSNSVVASNPGTNINSSTVVNTGDNRYYLDTTSLSSGYYLLEITNEKKEKFYLRFLK